MPKGNNKLNFLLLRLEDLCVLKKIIPLIFIKLLLSIFVTTQILVFFQIILKICVFRETVSKLIFNSISLTYFIIMSLFTFNSMKSFRKTIDKI